MKKHQKANKSVIFATKYNTLNHGIIFRRSYRKPEEEEELKLFAVPCFQEKQKN